MMNKIKAFFNKNGTVARNGLPFVGALAALTAIYWLTTSVEPGWITYWMQVPALVIILLTALARVNDIKAMGLRWHFRRIGLLLVAIGAVSLIIGNAIGAYNVFPSWRTVMFMWGFAITWITTPNMPPWHKYISGEYKLRKGQTPLEPQSDSMD